MTNFQSQRSSSGFHWLTPERALFFVPVLTSVGLSVLLVLLIVFPLWRLVRQRQVVVEDLSIKSLELPQLEKDLLQQLALKIQIEEQEERLIKMLAGTKDLGTFLSGLNRLAVQNQVTVVLSEPGEVEVWYPPSEFEDNSSTSSDSLLQEGLEKRSALIKVQGAFRDIQGFLQDLESLEVFVITSDLSMEAIRSAGQGANSEELIQARLELQLSAYGRKAKANRGKTVVKEEVGP